MLACVDQWGSPFVADPPLPVLLLHVPHLSLLSWSSPGCFTEAQLPLSAAPWCSWVGQGWLTWPAFYCHGLFWSGDLFLGVRAGRAWGAMGMQCCSALPHALCCVFKDQSAAVMVSTMLCSQPDPKAFPAALASAFFVPAFPLLQNSHLSVPTLLSQFTASGHSRVLRL